MAENEPKVNILKKSNAPPRITKVERDAKELSIGTKSKKHDHKSICKHCKESGSLLYCSNCPSAYHLNCIKMKDSDIPNGNWYCFRCVPNAEKKFREELIKHEKSERNSKTGKIKEVLSGLSTFERDKVVEKFGKKYPQFVRQTKIAYPIEDSLLALDSEFHQVTLLAIPAPIPWNYPQDCFLDILAITNFVYCFSSHIRVSGFSIDVLYTELNKDTESHLIKEIVMALSKELILHILSKENLDEQLSGQNKFLYSSYKLSSIFNIIDYLPYSWLTLLFEIMTSNTFKDHTEETPIEHILQKIEEFPIENYFFKYSLSEKISCITFLISCFCDTKVFHEVLSDRIDRRAELSKEKTLIKTQIKELEQKQSSDIKTINVTRKSTSISDKIIKLQHKVSDLSCKIDDIQVRISPIGTDRYYNEYYLFKFDLSKIFVLKPTENTWYYIDTKQHIDALINSLCSKGIRENKLLENLKLKLPSMKLNEPAKESKPEDYYNKLSEFKNVESDLQSIKKILLDIEKKFSKYLNKSNKQWDTDNGQEQWKALVNSTESISELVELLLEHYEKSSTPLRVALYDSNSDENSDDKECERKYRKVSIRIWQDFGDHNTIWEQLVQSIVNSQQLILAIGIYVSVLEHYIQKKTENSRHEDKKKPKEDKKKKEGRNKKNGIKHEDNCFFCEDGGQLICCEGCTRVVHPECIGFDQVPDNDWFCDNCNKHGIRVTRSRTRLRKLNT
jgi:Williams-Beuren syndrome DDT (WSD), D-TOX E motif/PHD-finger